MERGGGGKKLLELDSPGREYRPIHDSWGTRPRRDVRLCRRILINRRRRCGCRSRSRVCSIRRRRRRRRRPRDEEDEDVGEDEGQAGGDEAETDQYLKMKNETCYL